MEPVGRPGSNHSSSEIGDAGKPKWSLGGPRTIFIVLLLAFAIRAPSLNAPIAAKHSWRQADTAAVARNFYRDGFRLFHPQIDWRGDGPGYVEMEFPAFSYAMALCYLVIGEHEAAGRLLAILVSLCATYFLYRLIERHVDRKTALWAALFYVILPLNVLQGRNIMPDGGMLAASAAGLYFFSVWTRSQAWKHWLLAWLGITLAVLLKLPTLYLGLPLLWLAWQRAGARSILNWRVWLFATAVLVPVATWYGHAYALGQQSGLSFGVLYPEKWAQWHLLTTLRFYQRIIFVSIAERHLVWAGFGLFALGLILPRIRRSERLFDVWLLALAIYILIAQKGNFVHDYYQLPFVLPAVVYIGKVYARFWPRFRVLLLVALLATGLVSARKYARIVHGEYLGRSVKYPAAQVVQETTEAQDLIVVVSEAGAGDPTMLYLCDRKGWLREPSTMDAVAIENLAGRGAKALVVLPSELRSETARKWLEDLRRRYRVAHDDGRLFLCNLDDH